MLLIICVERRKNSGGCSDMVWILASSRSHSEHASLHPELSRPPSVGRPPGGLLGDMAAIFSVARLRPPSLTDYTLPVLRSQPNLPQVGNLCQMDWLPFLRAGPLASHPVAIVDTLRTKYRRSSTRQQQVFWMPTAFQRWLLLTGVTASPLPRSPEMTSSASSITCLPTKVWNHTTHYCQIQGQVGLKWDLEEAFHINFSHGDFSRLAAGFFHLCPPVPPSVPQWNLSAVVRFYKQIDHDTWPPRLLLLKTLCLTELATGNCCPELAHLSQHAVVDLGTSITLPVMPWFLLKKLKQDTQDSVIRPHNVRKFAFNINWARRADLSHTLQHGFWASAHPFLSNYVQHISPTLPTCVAAGFLPQP